MFVESRIRQWTAAHSRSMGPVWLTAGLQGAAGCWKNIRGAAENVLTFPLCLPAGLKLIKSNSTPLKTAASSSSSSSSSSSALQPPPPPPPLSAVQLKDIVCYLSLLEGGRPEDKLECEWHCFCCIWVWLSRRLLRVQLGAGLVVSSRKGWVSHAGKKFDTHAAKIKKVARKSWKAPVIYSGIQLYIYSYSLYCTVRPDCPHLSNPKETWCFCFRSCTAENMCCSD